MDDYWCNFACRQGGRLSLTHWLGWTPKFGIAKFSLKKLKTSLSYAVLNLNRLGVTHECDGQTDGQMYRLAHSIMLRFTTLRGHKRVYTRQLNRKWSLEINCESLTVFVQHFKQDVLISITLAWIQKHVNNTGWTNYGCSYNCSCAACSWQR